MYKLYFDPDLSEIGTQAYATDSRGNGYEAVHTLDCSNKPSAGTVFDCMELEDDTSVTDFISLSNACRHFIVSDRVKSTLQQFALSNVTFYPVKLYWKGAYLRSDHWLVWFFGNELDRIDFYISDRLHAELRELNPTGIAFIGAKEFVEKFTGK
jgi:hypothetical protein